MITKLLSLDAAYRRPVVIAIHMVLIAAASASALWLRFDGEVPPVHLAAWLQVLPVVLLARGACFAVLRLYEGLWRYTGTWDLRNIILAVASSTAIIYVIAHPVMGVYAYPRSLFIIDALLATVLTGGIRVTRRLVTEMSRQRGGKRILIFGAGDAGEMILRDMRNKDWYGYQPVGFIDDNRAKVGRRIHGVPVLGTRTEISDVIGRVRPDEVLIAMPAAEPSAIRAIVKSLEQHNVPIRTLPSLRDVINGKVEVGQIRSLAIEDLLSRAPVGIDPAPLQSLIAGRRVLVTGAGGSIGSELCRQIAALQPATLVALDRYENTLHTLQLEIQDVHRCPTFQAVVADITDAARLEDVFGQHRPEIVFHAAAHKHVPLMEASPCEAVKNNVRGTRILIEAAKKHAVARFVLISTDKAVNPTSVMGASKRVAELVLQAHARNSKTVFTAVRFGNVLGSNGSVVPRFIEQIRSGGPVTVTHPEMRRFFMLIPEAVQLVLHAAAHAETGAVYVLEMGEQVKLVDMARHLIRLSGRIPDEDVKIAFVGLRPGEKLYEELVASGEEARPSGIEKIHCVRSASIPGAELLLAVGELELTAKRGASDLVRRYMSEIIGLHAGHPLAAASTLSVAPMISGISASVH